jgi:myo-inositol catabolism protein IolS
MEKTRLGRTGIEVSRLCIGCMQASGWASSDNVRFATTVRHALDMGLNFLDTAAAYGDGYSEELVSDAIARRRDQVVIATKFNFNQSHPNGVRLSLEQSLRRLRTDYVDLFQQHWPSPDIPLADTIGELERLKEEGKIRAIGVSNWMEPEWKEMGDPSRVDALQPAYNLLWRSLEANVLPSCRRYNIAVLPYSPLCQGVLAGRFKSLGDIPNDPRRSNRRLQPNVFPRVIEVVNVLREVAGKYGKTPAQTALRWLLDQDAITAVIVGASTPQQVDENLGALGWRLKAVDWQRLAEISWPLSAELGSWDTLWGWHPKKTEKVRLELYKATDFRSTGRRQKSEFQVVATFLACPTLSSRQKPTRIIATPNHCASVKPKAKTGFSRQNSTINRAKPDSAR